MWIKLLKLYGLLNIYSKKNDNIDINVTNNNVYISEEENVINYYVINYIYMLCGLIMILWLPIYLIVSSIINSDFRIIIFNLCPFMVLLQYIYGIIYFRKEHLYKIVNQNIAYENVANVIYVTPIILSLLINICHILFDNYNIFTVIFWNFYAYIIFITNTITLIFVCMTYLNKIISFFNELKNNTESGNIIDIVYIIEDYSKLKYEHANMVELFNSIFSNIVIFGICIIYFAFILDSISVIYYINCGLIGLILIICFTIITWIKSIVADIKIFINSNIFMSQYQDEYLLNNIIIGKDEENSIFDNIKKILNNNIDINSIDLVKELQYRIIIKQYEILFTNNWLILNNKLGDEWKKFYIFGFDIDDITPIKKLCAIILIVLAFAIPIYIF
jgi:hypothetical protein